MAATPYRDRLLSLPRFLSQTADDASAASADILAGLRLTGFFLEQHAFAHQTPVPPRGPLPAARDRLIAVLRRAAA